MDTSAYLKRQGWKGDGHSLDHHGRGIRKPLLVSKKIDYLGVGVNKHAAVSDQWWMRAFDQGLKDLGTGKVGALASVQKHGMNHGNLYGRFVKGEGVPGTFEEEQKEDEAVAVETEVNIEGTEPALEEKQDKKGKKEKKERKKERREKKLEKRRAKGEKKSRTQQKVDSALSYAQLKLKREKKKHEKAIKRAEKNEKLAATGKKHKVKHPVDKSKAVEKRRELEKALAKLEKARKRAKKAGREGGKESKAR